MQFIRGLAKLMWGESQLELVQLPSGQFSHIQDNDRRSVIYKQATAIIRKTREPYLYELLVSNSTGNADDSEIEEQSFLIDQVLDFQRSNGSRQSFSWKNLEKSGGIFEFAITSRGNQIIDLFELTFWQCVYERKFQRSHNDASDHDIQCLMKGESPLPLSVPTTPIKSEASTSRKGKGAENSASSVKQLPQFPALPTATSLLEISADLYIFNPESQEFLLHDRQVRCALLSPAPYNFWLSIQKQEDNSQLVYQPLEANMNPFFNNEHHSFIWCFYDSNETLWYTWSLKFNENDDSETRFRFAFGKCMYEALHREDFSDMKTNDSEYILSAYTATDIDMKDIDESESDQASENDEESDDEEQSSAGGLRSSSTADRKKDAFLSASKAKNSHLLVGTSHERTFVVRGSDIGVFKYSDDDRDIDYVASIKNVKTPGGQVFSPTKVMLHAQDSSMVLMRAGDDHHLYKMDLERGSVVEEWKVHDVMTVRDMCPDNKYAARTPNPTFVGMNERAIFRVDPRLKGHKLVDAESKQYVSKNAFSCLATTGQGELAVASEKGDIRLYNKLNMRAKTHLPGLGDAIRGIDVTEDGQYVLATTKTYLLLLCTDLEHSGDRNTSGFTKSMGDAKPIPRKLQLRPEHVACMGNEEVNFTTAKFNTGEMNERSIVASTGSYVITWNFRRVKAGHLYDYSIKKYQDTVVADNFKYGQDRTIVVALPDDVTVAAKSNMISPVKAFKAKDLRDSIVNSPF